MERESGACEVHRNWGRIGGSCRVIDKQIIYCSGRAPYREKNGFPSNTNYYSVIRFVVMCMATHMHLHLWLDAYLLAVLYSIIWVISLYGLSEKVR